MRITKILPISVLGLFMCFWPTLGIFIVLIYLCQHPRGVRPVAVEENACESISSSEGQTSLPQAQESGIASPFCRATPPPTSGETNLEAGQVCDQTNTQGQNGRLSDGGSHLCSPADESLFGDKPWRGSGWLTITRAVISSGSYAYVYEGCLQGSRNKKERVAVKNTVSPIGDRMHQALCREERIYTMLGEHPNIVEYKGSKIGDDSVVPNHFLVLKYVKSSLQKMIDDDHSLKTYRQLMGVWVGIASALELLHSKKLVHLDLKPSNVLLTPDLVPKLCDFGISRFREGDFLSLDQVTGSPMYIAPEIYFGSYLSRQGVSFSVTDAVDIYSLGALMYTCIMGTVVSVWDENKELTANGQFVEMVACRGYAPIKVPLHCPEELRLLIADCLKFDYDSMSSQMFGRPDARQILIRFQEMGSRPWLDEIVPRKKL